MYSFKVVEVNEVCRLVKESVLSRRATPYIFLYGTAYMLFPIMARKFNSSGTQVTAGSATPAELRGLLSRGGKALCTSFTVWRGFLCLEYFYYEL